MMANTVHVVYQLDDATKKRISEAGEALPTVVEIAATALETWQGRGFVRCEPDGSEFKEPAAPAGGKGGPVGGSAGSEG